MRPVSQNPHLVSPKLHLLHRAIHTPNPPSPPLAGLSSLATTISDLVLSHPSNDPQTLAKSLSSHLPSSSPSSIPDLVLKLLWNHAPRALLFFNALLLLSPHPPPSSTLTLATDLAARLHDHSTLHRLISLRPPSPRAFSCLFERYAAHGKPDRAIRLFLSMRHRHGCSQSLPAFNSLLDALCKSRRVAKASSLVKSLRSHFHPDVITYNILADGWCRMKNTSKALETLKEMIDSGIQPTINSYNIILKGFFRSGQIKHGWNFFIEMKRRRNCRPDVVSHTTVVHGLGIAGDIDKARKVFDEMLGEGCLPSVATYNALVQVICKKGKVEDALKVFDGMLAKGYVPNSITYNLVIRGLCHAGETARAMEFLNRVEEEDDRRTNVQSYNIVVRYLMEDGEMEKGLEVFERMKRKGRCLPNLDTYNVIISGMFKRKRPEDVVVAGKMVVEMVERGFLPRRFMFNKVLNGLLMTGKPEVC
ncbi:pentatricopeptide repeat-containing protein At1g74900, mitochondrial-like [Dioscorea cayenensis subsp. rotundata]|uniref:Pentatricopeptide repeat-containing protein At1g74900, mitochondrial-like n=1 Tax=Dioscorea cayennensis subsp. rotundata TaxID=55577 RepID=A0AB40CFX2_DIOCR|nr:pentatricopeptide repeat-containing protein At1g74900, mitochondrial-like [Dioscorea cayenensis subsp. rotundata]